MTLCSTKSFCSIFLKVQKLTLHSLSGKYSDSFYLINFLQVYHGISRCTFLQWIHYETNGIHYITKLNFYYSHSKCFICAQCIIQHYLIRWTLIQKLSYKRLLCDHLVIRIASKTIELVLRLQTILNHRLKSDICPWERSSKTIWTYFRHRRHIICWCNYCLFKTKQTFNPYTSLGCYNL